jgi:hypothetical protein
MAERGGFEPPVLFRHSRFPGVRVKPLCHLSTVLFLIAREGRKSKLIPPGAFGFVAEIHGVGL